MNKQFKHIQFLMNAYTKDSAGVGSISRDLAKEVFKLYKSKISI